ncbi:Lysine 6-dehydrogenase [Rosistilla carotiformis]|uniref:Lysine 6-dehydrogenase n=1 Tax=Rosistilla carotiformis TaxID=2528017 RepID=A0A518JVB3_9BACT|nr:saccharopine dehydrogenase NADP-binding domain-containing protein [Rosistilla carotiformis]QDV69466.1 Lysine 6-dehydrogenase [Rosistilla carotiformis]
MTNVLLLGAGKIGRMIAGFLAETGDYQVTVADSRPETLTRFQSMPAVDTLQIDAGNRSELAAAMASRGIVISALSFHFNPLIAEVALQTGSSYFDLTEDVQTTRAVQAVAQNAAAGQIFMPQCGLAPGFISIIARHLSGEFEQLESVRMRVGALPQYPTDALKYNLTWSTDGLINEYCNPCETIHQGERIDSLPLEGLEHFSIDGARYEAFNTSGGLGTLCDTLRDSVQSLNYKTIRYVGHRDLVAFLVNDLRLGSRRELLKDILEHAVPVTFQDLVITFCTVTGQRNGQLVQLSDARKIYARQIGGEQWSAIQITTAAAICAVVDLHVAGLLPRQGFVRQEQVRFDQFIANRFGKHYQTGQQPDIREPGAV